MMIDLDCLRQELLCHYEAVGAFADVTFRRIDPDASAPVNIYGERPRDDKVYLEFPRRVVVDERPRENIHGRTGGQVDADIVLELYDWDGYVPEHPDLVDYRGVTYEVQRISRIHPSGADNQLGYQIAAKRHR